MKTTAALLTVLCVVGQARSQAELPMVGVLNLESRTVPAAELDALSDRLRLELFRTGVFQVIERERMDAILLEQGFQASECMATECAIEMGQLTGATYMVAGKVSRVGSVLSITARMISVETGTIERTAVHDCPCELEIVLTRVLREVAVELAGDEVDTWGEEDVFSQEDEGNQIETHADIEPEPPEGHPMAEQGSKGLGDQSRRTMRNTRDDYVLLGLIGVSAAWMKPLEGRSDIGVEIGLGILGEFKGLNTVAIWNIHMRPDASFDPYLQLAAGIMSGQREETVGLLGLNTEWRDFTSFWGGAGIGMRFGRMGAIIRVATMPTLSLSYHY
jgi:TolB-like protein